MTPPSRSDDPFSSGESPNLPLSAEPGERPDGLASMPRFNEDGSPLPMEQAPPPRSSSAAPAGGASLRRPLDRLPLDDDDDDAALGADDAPLSRLRGRTIKGAKTKRAKTPFREEDENKELKGCAGILVMALLAGGLWWGLKDVVNLSGGGAESASVTSRSAPPPITKVEAIPEKRVVSEPTEGRTVLARKLTAPPEEDPPPTNSAAAAGRREVTTAAIMGLADQLPSPTVDPLLEAVTAQSVCYHGRPARRVGSLYGLKGGFGISFAPPDRPTGLPRLEFMPPTLPESPPILFYVSFADPPIKGFDGKQARTVPNTPRSVGRVILAWIAELADSDCADTVGATAGGANAGGAGAGR